MRARPRRVEPEWLDSLPADDRRAIRSRRDLRRVNALMLQPGIMRRLILSAVKDHAPRAILDLGSGDGTFMLKVIRPLAQRWPPISVTMLDRHPVVAAKTRDAFRSLGWTVEVVAEDVIEFLVGRHVPAADVVTANLFLHHFRDAQLGELLHRVAAIAPRFVACEPRRSARARAASRLLWAIGCNDVSRHDALASVRAGFCGRELSALWPKQSGWTICERPAGLFSHAFVARYAEAPGR